MQDQYKATIGYMHKEMDSLKAENKGQIREYIPTRGLTSRVKIQTGDAAVFKSRCSELLFSFLIPDEAKAAPETKRNEDLMRQGRATLLLCLHRS